VTLKQKLSEIEKEFKELEQKLLEPEAIKDRERYQKLTRRYAQLSSILEEYKKLRRLWQKEAELSLLLKNEKNGELIELAKEELKELSAEVSLITQNLEKLLSPVPAEERRNTIVEIRAGAGGDEAALFAADLFKMYSKYAEKKGWSVEIIDAHPTPGGGFKEIIFIIEGKDSFKDFQFESGVHRVQRIPVTESSGRIHTSTATVAVLPEAEEAEVELSPQDIRIDVFRASSAGGQHVNVTDSAVRITHLPTGIVVQCQDERSQHKNKAKALRVLRSRLKKMVEEKQRAERAKERREQVGRGMRSEKIRTYNFPQNRVTDHRAGISFYNLDRILAGELSEVISAVAKQVKEEEIT
jgi:peptide chain release factor 1